MADNEQLILSISADTRAMQRQLDKLVSQLGNVDNDLDNAFKSKPAQIDNVAKSLGKTRFETANLAAQFQDIAVQLQGGQSPFTIALQQGTQISQVLGRQGASGVVGLLGTAFQSLLSPVSLATIGIIALGGFAVQYGAKAIGAVDDLDDKLKAHSELIKSLKDAYGEAGKGVDTAVNESTAVLKTLLGLSTADLQKQFRNLANAAVTSMTDFTQMGDAVGINIESTSRKFSAFKGPIDDFRDSVKSGTPDVRAFRDAVAAIAETSSDEKVRKLAQELLSATDQANKISLALDGSSKSLRNFGSEALAAAEQGEAFAKALKALDSTVSPKLDDRQKIMENYNKALEKAGSTEERLAAARGRDSQLSVLADNDRKKAAEDAAKEAESAQKRFDGAIASTQKNSATVAASADAIGLGAGALARMRTEARLTEAAQQAFGDVSDKVRDKITAQANAAGEAADKLARARISANTEFGAKTAFLTSEDAQIAAQLASIYGNDIPVALSSTEAAGLRAVNTLRTISQVGQDINRGFLTDFSQQIRNGASAMDALRSAGVNALGKISDKLMQMAADNLWASAFGGSTVGLGGLFSGLFGGGASSPTMVTGAAGNLAVPTFASGTDFAPGGLSLVGEKGPELVNLPRGAQVIPNDVLRSGGASSSIVVGGTTINIQGSADQQTIAVMRQELARRDAEMPSRVVAAVREARKTRQLA